ncbi:DNA repair exonuclease [Candidatus Woesearchaeota archaeon]|nr:DNA repair exonuclease [Candidatus Woesearchaeota archaeon]
MKFAHMADIHIGGWKEPEIKELGLKAFKEAVDKCLQEKVSFILISGDLFNTALPPIELIRDAAAALKKAKDNGINVYMIPGSHDFSPSGKTMLEVLEKAGLIDIVNKFDDNGLLTFTEDKTGAKITGLLGKKGGLEIKEYESLEKKHLEEETGFKVWMFHTALEEFKPESMEKMEAMATAALPKNFNYYAGGHVHYIFQKRDKNSLIMFPGALFPNNFKELEEFKHGGFYIVDDSLNYEYVHINLKDVKSYFFDANNKTPDALKQEILDKVSDYENKIVTLRIEGVLESGKPSDIDFKEIMAKMKSAFYVLKNTNKLTTKEFEELEVETGNVDDIERKIIQEHLGQISFMNAEDEAKITEALINALNQEKEEGEKNADFELRVLVDSIKVLNLEPISRGIA